MVPEDDGNQTQHTGKRLGFYDQYVLINSLNFL